MIKSAFILFLVSSLLFFSIFVTSYLNPIFACHDPLNPTADNRPANPNYGPCPGGLPQIEDTVKQIISVTVPLAFVVLVTVLFIAGIKFLTSGGEAKALQSASLTATWALLGILFLAIIWLILQLIKVFTGIDVTTFDIQVL